MAEDTVKEWMGSQGEKWTDQPFHRLWLLDQARTLIDFFQPAFHNPEGGFFAMDGTGQRYSSVPANGELRSLHETTRMVHCSAIGHMLGMPGCAGELDHGMQFLWNRHRDTVNGGYFWGVDDVGAPDPTKQAYGHAFVLLASASAKVIGYPDADRMLEDATDVLTTRFWDSVVGATTEEYLQDWEPFSTYRGQNSNMHLTEALMAAYEATQDRMYLDMAQKIAELIINTHAREQTWRVVEHFDTAWKVDRDFVGDPMFRPAGTTPGHSLEWSRLLIQLWELGDRAHDWMLPAAEALFLAACEQGWDDEKGGFYYTLNWDGTPDQTDRYWWPCSEGIAAASVLLKVSDDVRFELWYRRIWSFTRRHVIDRENGGWFPELDENLVPVERVFRGKPDLYHSIQACLIPLFPTHGSLTKHLQGDQSNLLTG